jgi:hypothetical protein
MKVKLEALEEISRLKLEKATEECKTAVLEEKFVKLQGFQQHRRFFNAGRSVSG